MDALRVAVVGALLALWACVTSFVLGSEAGQRSSNIKLSAWGKYLGDATVTAAILDRLAMTAIRLDIDGPSYRQHLAHQRAEPVESDAEPEPNPA